MNINRPWKKYSFMFTQEEYLNIWLVYALGAGLLIACWWYFSRIIAWRELRQLSRIVVVFSLLTPWYSDLEYHFMAPAIVVSTVEGLSYGSEAFWRAGTPLLISLIFAVVISLVWSIWRWRRSIGAENDFDHTSQDSVGGNKPAQKDEFLDD